jgi:L-ascorbate metabolism protein UlaG (beta-lactamase superfamily)
MKITWLGHSGFRIEIGKQILLVDPWFTGNPVFPEGKKEEAVVGATHILVSHGHGDHSADAAALASELGVPVVGIYDLTTFWEARHDIATLGLNKGGTVDLGDDVKVTMVNAVHSSSTASDNGPIYCGAEAGFMIEGEGRVIYFSGDTDVMADMRIFHDLHQPDIGILCCGGRFTMDMRRAAYAAKTFFAFRTVIPCHFGTFPFLEQSAQPLVEALPGTDVQVPEVMRSITL